MRRLKLPFALIVFATAATFALDGRWPWRRLEVNAAPATVMSATGLAPAPAFQPVSIQIADTLRRGETLSTLFARHGISDLDFSSVRAVLDPRRLRPGLVFHITRPAPDSAPSQISVRADAETRLHFARAADGWSTSAETIRWTPQVVRVAGDISASLYDALDKQIPDSVLGGAERMRLAWDIADIYDWKVDFTRDLQPGDHFQFLVERLVSDEGEVRFGRVIASDLTAGGESLTAFRFTAKGGRSEFYDAKGVSLRQAFLRVPLEFRRISSTFTSARFHPVLGIVRKHEGTDYAASAGTPVRAVSDGVVLRAGKAGGYGNLIEMRHRGGISTRYGHLRAFAKGIRTGAHVTMGQVIGYVGMTGLATGPHLHYEFRMNGVAKDSRTVRLPGGWPLEGGDLRAFKTREHELAAQLYGDEMPAAEGPLVALN